MAEHPIGSQRLVNDRDEPRMHMHIRINKRESEISKRHLGEEREHEGEVELCMMWVNPCSMAASM
jgi:hypothetical protein